MDKLQSTNLIPVSKERINAFVEAGKMDTSINVTGMQGNRRIITAVFPDAANRPHNWRADDVKEVVAYLQQGRSSKAKRAAIALLESMLFRHESARR